jgi:MFS family permease
VGSTGSERVFSRDFAFATTANLFTALGQQMLLATLPVYVIQMGGTNAQAGLITATAAITALIVRPFAGWLSDAWGRRPVVLLGCASYIAASAMYLLATTVAMLGLGRVAHGFALSNYTTGANTYIADLAPPRRRAEAIGLFAATADLGMITGPAVGFFIAGLLGFHQLFYFSGFMAVLCLVCSLFARERRIRPAARRTKWSFRTGLIAIDALPLAWMAFCLGLGMGPVNTFLSIFATARGLTNPGLFFSTQAVALLVTRTFAGRVADRYGRNVVIVPGLIAGALGILLLPFATTLPAFLVSAVLWGMGFGCAQPASMALLVDNVPGEERGLALSTYFMGFDVGIGLGAVALGVVSQTLGWEVMWPISAVCVLLGLLGLKRRPSRGESAARLHA